MKYTIDEVKEWCVQVETSDGKWIMARPLNHEYTTLWERMKLALGVLTKKYDVLDWEEEKVDTQGKYRHTSDIEKV